MGLELGVEDRVFVYGSLKRGLIHHDELDGTRFLGEARLLGYRLVLYEESYPALVENPGSELSVCGEVFSVSPEQLTHLDAFEDCPRLYQRVRVQLDWGIHPWAYVIPPDIGARYITISGVWTGERTSDCE